jgi:(heptosyl)LPS beta-1,4-glucosyltransferase
VAKCEAGTSVKDSQKIADISQEESSAIDSEEIGNPELTAVILTFNEEANIVDCIESLRWTDRIVVIDCFSEDKTVVLAQAAGAEIETVAFENFAQQRNSALGLVESDWIFFVDADERGNAELGQEIRLRLVEGKEVAWYVPRHNYIFGKLTMGAGWYPDYQLRLFRRGFVRYERPVHEIAVVDGGIGYLANPIIHYNYRDTEHFHEKQRFYTDYDASVLYERGVRPKSYTYISQPLRQFVWRFFTLGGYKDGFHGVRLSLYMSYYEWLKYRRLNKLLSEPPVS